jgi:branched-chain amino acid aminotransferase
MTSRSVVPPTDKLDWTTIGFQYRDTNGFVKYTWTEETGWDEGKFLTDPMLNIHVCATGLHYGQQVISSLI